MEQTIGKRIAACRKRMGLTQDALAEQLGVTVIDEDQFMEMTK